MNARRLNFGKRHDAPRQLAFERTLVIDLFLEIRKAEIRPVEYLKADAAAFRQSLAGKLDANFGKLIGCHFDRSSVRSKFVRDFQLLQFLNDALGFLRIEIGIERLILHAIDKINQCPQKNQNQSGRAG